MGNIKRTDIIAIAAASAAMLVALVSLAGVIISVPLSILSLTYSNKANQIAEESYGIAYKSKIPRIVITKETDMVTVTNEGWVAIDFHADVREILILETRGYDSETYIELGGYYQHEPTYDLTGLLQTSSYEGNASYLRSIRHSFEEAAEKDGFNADMRSRTLVSVEYYDFKEIWWEEYFRIGSGRPSKITEDEWTEMYDSGRANKSLVREEGLRPYVDELDGAELWEWYKDKILLCD